MGLMGGHDTLVIGIRSKEVTLARLICNFTSLLKLLQSLSIGLSVPLKGRNFPYDTMLLCSVRRSRHHGRDCQHSW